MSDPKALEQTRNHLGNVLMLLDEGRFRGNLMQNVFFAKEFIGSMYQQVDNDLKAAQKVEEVKPSEEVSNASN